MVNLLTMKSTVFFDWKLEVTLHGLKPQAWTLEVAG